MRQPTSLVSFCSFCTTGLRSEPMQGGKGKGAAVLTSLAAASSFYQREDNRVSGELSISSESTNLFLGLLRGILELFRFALLKVISQSARSANM